MTAEHLEIANRISEKIERIKRQLNDLEYIEKCSNVQLAVKDERKMCDSYVAVPVGSVKRLVVNEVKHVLSRQLAEAEREFRKL